MKVDFNTAVRLKGAGYTEPCSFFFKKETEELHNRPSPSPFNHNQYDDTLSAPEVFDVFLWLLAKKIFVCVQPIDDWGTWYYEVVVEDCMSPFFNATLDTTNEYNSYDVAMLAGIKEGIWTSLEQPDIKTEENIKSWDDSHNDVDIFYYEDKIAEQKLIEYLEQNENEI